ncbi:hypothetical protein HBA55_14035 [Pseudomaricurvus alkylphenolicus]|jgi:hypothetical protein|uniref:hypothetical protein n=1 Tax=Pseudomaricurvus alkylphenolicus TaxID=1306991 RepID=UPI00141FE8C5|nr:hypothetical protein [Pseudomaricurvus alkylphenolicus]NIB40716.1 hypothetical protein [Pseudomaricurvus alkylphenolicus]
MKKLTALMLATTLYSGATLACTKPSAPVLPDVNTAVTAQMVKAKNEVKAYMAAAQDYLSCVKSTADHNAMVDDMQKLADSFNSIVRQYKARMAAA